MTWYSVAPGRQKRMARWWARAAMCAEVRMSSSSRARLVEAHVVQRVIERHELLRRVAPVARLGAQPVDPADHALVKVRVDAHGVEHARAVLEQAGQDLVHVA